MIIKGLFTKKYTYKDIFSQCQCIKLYSHSTFVKISQTNRIIPPVSNQQSNKLLL